MNAAQQHDVISHSRRDSNTPTQPAVPYSQYEGTYEELSPPYTTASSNYTTISDQMDAFPAKRRKLSEPSPTESGISVQYVTTAGTGGRRDSSAGVSPTEARRASIGGRSNGKPTPPPTGTSTKSKRVRTGCLTCRERHLKCDEGAPVCLNCRKSSRECKRGVRLNFIDTQCKDPHMIPPTLDWSVQFQDESRLIASEYRGGLGRYTHLDQKEITPPREMEPNLASRQIRTSSDATFSQSGPGVVHPGTLRQASGGPGGYEDAQSRLPGSRRGSEAFGAPPPRPNTLQSSGSSTLNGARDLLSLHEESRPRSQGPPDRAASVSTSLMPQLSDTPPFRSRCLDANKSNMSPDGLMTPPNEKAMGERVYLQTEEEIEFMQAFVNDVAIWMDSMDSGSHFSRVIPYLALKSPMLLNAVLACGVKYLTLVDSYKGGKDLFYYDTATQQLLRTLSNPDRNTVECATTAVVLNVYEIMSETPGQRMSHIAGARALIRECGWSAKSQGIAGACFWLNVGMEVLSCLSFNWQTAWDPEQWGMEYNLTDLGEEGNNTSIKDELPPRDGAPAFVSGDEEVAWVHRILYIMAKVANFRSTTPRFQEASRINEEARTQSRYTVWKELLNMCRVWNTECPRPLRPFGYSHTKSTKSLFPNVWLISRAALVGRLFYHTSMCLLAQINPRSPGEKEQNLEARLHHAHQVCGIVAHTTDRGVASVAIRSVATTSAVLTDRAEQEEVIAMLEKITHDTGWRLDKVLGDLKSTWGWATPTITSSSRTASIHSVGSNTPSSRFGPTGPPAPSQLYQPAQVQRQLAGLSNTANPPAKSMQNGGLVNPMLARADFSLDDHPYQRWYAPPNRATAYSASGIWPA